MSPPEDNPADQNPWEDDPAYQAFVEEQTKSCHCRPDHMRPCQGVLAGGPCDGIDWEPEEEEEIDGYEIGYDDDD